MSVPVQLLAKCPDLEEIILKIASGVAVYARLGGEEARHALQVRRLCLGERLDLVDGQGLRLCCVVASEDDAILAQTSCYNLVAVEPKSPSHFLYVQVLEIQQETKLEPQLVIVQAIAKGGRDELAIEAATECGVDRVIAWQSERSISRWIPAKQLKGLARWQHLLQEAAKQARRAWVPSCEQCINSRQIYQEIMQANSKNTLVLVLHESASQSLIMRLRQLAAKTIGNPSEKKCAEVLKEDNWQVQVEKYLVGFSQIWLLVGPEGGISSTEIAAFEQAGAQVVLAGQHVMRTSTAGSVVLGYLSALLGRWDKLRASQ